MSFIENANAVAFLILPWLFGFSALIFCISMLYFIYKRNIAGGSLCATLAVVSVLLGYFPQIDSFKALMVDVKLVHHINEGNELLKKIKSLSLVSAQASIFSISTGGFLTSSNYDKRQALINSIIKQLDTIGATEDQKREAAKPIFDIVGFNLLNIFEQSLMQHHNAVLGSPMPAESIGLQTKLNNIPIETAGLNALDRPNKLKDWLAAVKSIVPVAATDKEFTDKLEDSLIHLDKDLVTKVIFTDELQQILDFSDGNAPAAAERLVKGK